MITIKSPREVETMAAAGSILATTLARVVERVEPGVSTEDLDSLAEQFIRSHSGAKPSFKGLYGFPKSLCTSINNEIVHGIPSKGLHADSAVTVPVGEISDDTTRLLKVTRKALEAGIEAATLDNHVGDIGHAVQTVAEALGLPLKKAAAGIIDIVNENMFGALRMVSVEQGHDPREFALIAFGGAGPLHANALGRLMGSWPVIIPPGPGVLCAYGDAATRIRDEASRTFIRRFPDTSADELPCWTRKTSRVASSR